MTQLGKTNISDLGIFLQLQKNGGVVGRSGVIFRCLLFIRWAERIHRLRLDQGQRLEITQRRTCAGYDSEEPTVTRGFGTPSAEMCDGVILLGRKEREGAWERG